MEKAIYAGQAYNSTSSAFHERVLSLSFSETCVLLLEITLRKQEWRIVKSTSFYQYGPALVRSSVQIRIVECILPCDRFFSWLYYTLFPPCAGN